MASTINAMPLMQPMMRQAMALVPSPQFAAHMMRPGINGYSTKYVLVRRNSAFELKRLFISHSDDMPESGQIQKINKYDVFRRRYWNYTFVGNG